MAHLVKLFGHDRLELVIVKDLASEGSCDEAVQGVDGILHVSPIATVRRSTEEVITDC